MFETKLIKCFPCQVHSSYLSLNFLIFFYSFVTFAVFLFLCLACYYNQRTIPYFSWYFRSLARSFPVCFFHFSFCVVFMQTSMFSRGGRWDFRFWPSLCRFFGFVVRCGFRFFRFLAFGCSIFWQK